MPAELSDLSRASDDLLHKEQARLLRQIHDLGQRASMHREVLQHLDEELAQAERLLREIEELSDLRPQLRMERLDRQLRGLRLQEVAVEVLRRRVGRDRPIHYREWFALLRSEGFEVVGRNPLNSFLTGVARADGVERVGVRTGLYRLVG